MELHQIEAYLKSPDPQNRLKAITELRNHESGVVVPLLKESIYDKEFIVRSLVATSLGHKQSDEAFQLLLDLIEHDRDCNVRAEAANSLAKYGDKAIPYLERLFQRDSNWLVRQSIFAALEIADHPAIFLKLCLWGLKGDDAIVQQSAITNLGQLAQTPQSPAALELLLAAMDSSKSSIRAQVARVLRYFDDPRVPDVLLKLRQDADYRVVGATFEGLL